MGIVSPGINGWKEERMPMRRCPLTTGEEPPIRRLAAFRKAPYHLAQRARVIIAVLGAPNSRALQRGRTAPRGRASDGVRPRLTLPMPPAPPARPVGGAG